MRPAKMFQSLALGPSHFISVVMFSLCFVFIFGLPSEGAALSLGEYLSQVKQANTTLRSSVLRAHALDHRVDPVGTWEDPFIAAGVDQIPFDGEMGSVTRYQISQTIPFPGKLSEKTSAADYRAKSAKSDVETFNREVTVLATQAFYRYYYNKKAIALNERLTSLVEGTVGSTKARYQTGEAGHHDWLLAKIERSVFEVERMRLMREQKTILAVVNELRDQPSETPVGDVSPQFSNADINESEIPSIEMQPELKSLEFFVAQVENEKNLARLSYFPDIVIQGMAMYPSPEMMEEKSNWGVMLGLNLPLYFWRKQSELSKAAALDKEAAILEKRNVENRLTTELLDAREQFKTARDVVKLYETDVIPTTSLAVQNAKSGYVAKRLPLTQYLDIIRVQRTQELEYLAAQIDVELARTRIKELLSAPPLLKIAPTKPSLFGSGGMGDNAMGSDTVNMGSGMKGSIKQSKGSVGTSNTGGTGMGNM